MQDRLKFRVWNKNEKQFIETLNGGLGVELGIAIDLNGNLLQVDYSYDDNGTDTLKNENDLILMQCTGLKDKNGKLIYEEDIVKVPDNWDEFGMMAGEKREVYFKEGGFRLKPKYQGKGIGYWLEDTKEFEIIGNIYENPELLEQKA